MTVSVDDAIAAFVAEAEKHEKETGSEFCEDTRVSLVVFTMLHLGLGLWSLGQIAEGLAEMLEVNEANLEAETDEWPDKVGTE